MLTDQELRHVAAMLRASKLCTTCIVIRKKIAMELKVRKAQRRVIRHWRERGQ